MISTRKKKGWIPGGIRTLALWNHCIRSQLILKIKEKVLFYHFLVDRSELCVTDRQSPAAAAEQTQHSTFPTLLIMSTLMRER